MTLRTLTRTYYTEPLSDGRVWHCGACPEIPGCVVYSEDQKEVEGMLDIAIESMKDWAPAAAVAPTVTVAARSIAGREVPIRFLVLHPPRAASNVTSETRTSAGRGLQTA